VTLFIDHLQIVTASNYNTIANFHNFQITTARAKPSESASTSRFLVTYLNNGDSSASVLTSLLSGEYPTAELFLQTLRSVLVIISRHGPLRKHRVSLLKFNCCLLRICCLAASVVSLFVSRSLPNNGLTCYKTIGQQKSVDTLLTMSLHGNCDTIY
jgi:hypothetical protein